MKFSDQAHIAALVLCAGSGRRTGLGYNKILYSLGRKSVLETTLDAFAQSSVQDVYLVINPADEDAIRALVAPYENIRLVYGGDTRMQSVRNGLQAANGCEIVVIHDGARPFVTPALINATIAEAAAHGSGISSLPATDTIKQTDKQCVRTLPRDTLRIAQTPQTFVYAQIAKAYETVTEECTDDAEVYERAGYIPRLIQGDYENIKITTTADLFRGTPQRTKMGIGYDVHRLVAGRKLILGGVEIAHTKGLEGHSDADVLTHAITDALLSAAGLPDIGVLFPDNDPKTEGICSLLLLDKAAALLAEKGFSIGNISAVVMAQKPKLMTHIPVMRKTLAERLHIETDRVNISATTTETLGIVGEEKGMAASASCLLFY
ncbi:MAG: 2-C-methyl-D-erythritol 2,4-cyclodiphosphate synthase [Clostridia bacterium]|nr:2-C-methyl-D-erythritol 2,4-cyclodiphosphate synthase [Clostridia bacterium]